MTLGVGVCGVFRSLGVSLAPVVSYNVVRQRSPILVHDPNLGDVPDGLEQPGRPYHRRFSIDPVRYATPLDRHCNTDSFDTQTVSKGINGKL
jgi:hypothetical protein